LEERIVLSGMMGSGKTTVGRLLSRWLGWGFVDTDQEIEREVGKNIERIFEEEGEGFFREKESGVIRQVSQMQRVVIATGGGALLSGENRQALSNSQLFFLHAKPETLARRLADSYPRPLLWGREVVKRLRQILKARQESYQAIRCWLDTEDLRPEEVAVEVLYHLPPRVRLVADEPEKIWLGRGSLNALPDILDNSPTFVMLQDGLPRVFQQKLESLGVESLLLPPGEEVKQLRFAEQVYRWLAERRAERGSPLMAVGGGSLLDLAGFVAATFKRGLSLHLVPTTLLAQADAAIGGKNALDLGPVKNVVGTFYHPCNVVADLYFLLTLPDAEYRSGLAEVLKAGLIGDRGIVELLKKDDVGERRLDLLEELVQRSVKVKMELVKKDFAEESGERRFLNFGHTLGHALELLLGLRHGEAISVGMVFALKVGEGLGVTRRGLREEVEEVLQKLGLPVELEFPREPILEKLLQDKKLEKGKIHFVVLEDYEKPGFCWLDPEELRRWL